MPYVPTKNKEFYFNVGSFRDLILAFIPRPLKDAKGDFNWLISRLCIEWLKFNGYIEWNRDTRSWVPAKKSGGYFNISTMIDAIQNCADEMKRRFLAPYEDGAKEKNGEI